MLGRFAVALSLVMVVGLFVVPPAPAAAAGVEPSELTGFWPRVGHRYKRKLLVIGKAVNGWHDEVSLSQLAVPAQAAAYAQTMRRTATRDDCPMSWVTLAWGRSGGYSTARSAFWRFARSALVRLDPPADGDPLWSGRKREIPLSMSENIATATPEQLEVLLVELVERVDTTNHAVTRVVWTPAARPFFAAGEVVADDSGALFWRPQGDSNP